ncbi:MAG: YcxB family protein [Pyrinomonadaceae bacterium]
MFEPIKVRVKFTTEDYAKALGFMTKQLWFVKYNHIILGVIVFIALLVFQFFGQFTLSPFVVLVDALAGVGFGLFTYLVLRFVSPMGINGSVARQMSSSPALQAEAEVTIDNQGVFGSSDLYSGHTKWEAYIKAIETETEFLLYTTTRFSHIVPKRVFASESDIVTVRTLISEKVGLTKA